MTVCISAICENSKSIVVAADRMVTFGPPISLQTDLQSERKITHLTGTVAVLYSGTVADGEEVISKVKQQSFPPKVPVNQIAESVKSAFIELKRRRQEETILRPFLGIDFPTFQGLLANSAASQVIQQIVGLLSQHNLQLDILIAGLDDTGAHLYVATHPGTLLSLGTMGYAAIGSGGLHASIGLSLRKQSKTLSLAQTLYNVFEAKKAAEVAPGVGKETDMDIICNGKIISIKESSLKLLEKLIKERPGISEKELKELQDECKHYVPAA